ncbi:MAG: hypothetical protein QXH55_04535 [Candidatus Korarchaeota archaeon]|nr:hypothetical protein [Thermoproteota archaeon]
MRAYEEVDPSRLSYLVMFTFDKSVGQDKIDEFSDSLLRNLGGRKRIYSNFCIISSRERITFIWPAQSQTNNAVVISRANTILYKKLQRILLKTLLGLIFAALAVAGVVAYLLWTGYFEWSLFERAFRVATRLAVYTLSAFIAALALTELISLDLNRRFIHKLDWLRNIILNNAEKVFSEKVEKTSDLPEPLRGTLACIKAQQLLAWGQLVRIRLPGL